MCRQWAILQSGADENPGNAIGMKDEWLIASQCRITFCSLRRPVVGRPLPIEVRDIQASPLLFLLIPPNQLLPLTLWFSVRTRRGAVIKNSTVRRPREAPSMTVEVA